VFSRILFVTMDTRDWGDRWNKAWFRIRLLRREIGYLYVVQYDQWPNPFGGYIEYYNDDGVFTFPYAFKLSQQGGEYAENFVSTIMLHAPDVYLDVLWTEPPSDNWEQLTQWGDVCHPDAHSQENRVIMDKFTKVPFL
jgi:hypothetical protein